MGRRDFTFPIRHLYTEGPSYWMVGVTGLSTGPESHDFCLLWSVSFYQPTRCALVSPLLCQESLYSTIGSLMRFPTTDRCIPERRWGKWGWGVLYRRTKRRKRTTLPGSIVSWTSQIPGRPKVVGPLSRSSLTSFSKTVLFLLLNPLNGLWLSVFDFVPSSRSTPPSLHGGWSPTSSTVT